MKDHIETQDSIHKPRLVLTVGVYGDEEKASRVVKKLIEEDFPADRISLLHKSGGGSGDDMLGLSYTDSEERIKVWGKHGLFWGGLSGLLVGATGLFFLPGLGPLLAAGPIIEVLGGAAAGAAVGGGAMAGAAALTGLTTALHRMGITQAEIEIIHQAIEHDHFVVILHCSPNEAEQYAIHLRWVGADPVLLIPVEH